MCPRGGRACGAPRTPVPVSWTTAGAPWHFLAEGMMGRPWVTMAWLRLAAVAPAVLCRVAQPLDHVFVRGPEGLLSVSSMTVSKTFITHLPNFPIGSTSLPCQPRPTFLNLLPLPLVRPCQPQSGRTQKALHLSGEEKGQGRCSLGIPHLLVHTPQDRESEGRSQKADSSSCSQTLLVLPPAGSFLQVPDPNQAQHS